MKTGYLDSFRGWSGWAAAAGIRLAAWTMMNALCAIGFVGFLIFALGGFTPEGFFSHADNLSSRYLAAPTDARIQFHAMAGIALLFLFGIFGALRAGSLTKVFSSREIAQ